MSVDPDDLLREAAARFVVQLAARDGGVATWDGLQSFEFQGRRIPLVGQRGIRKVAGYEAALTILTTYRLRPEDRPYDDSIGEDCYPRYKWRGSDGSKYDNVALRKAMELRKTVIWFEAVEPGVYVVHPRVWVVGEEPEERQFVLALDETMRNQWQPASFMSPADRALRQEYAEAIVRQRLHQPMFRRRVLKAYQTQCALCRLRVGDLLEAAHIKEDSEGGPPVVPNGISMCVIHHRAFDRLIVGIRPDFRIEVRRDVLGLHDGPTLQHTLQGVHESVLLLPRRVEARPDPALLEERYERFRAAG